MIMRVDVNPEMLRWARERADIKQDTLVKRFPMYIEWESGEKRPTLKQLEKLAKVTHAPVGSFFLSKPLEEQTPIPDLRTVGNKPINRPSVNLLDTIYLCQQCQDWYRDFARMEGEGPLPFVGSVTTASDIESTAESIRAALCFNVQERQELSTWTDALRKFIEQADSVGVLVMTSGIVAGNTHRKLDPDEFRGFALVDDVAPLVFVNGADTKAAQMFTLAHELAHIWLGQSAISSVDPTIFPSHATEAWCNKVAAEFLVPSASLYEEFRGGNSLPEELQRLARKYKVSTLVVLRRLFDMGTLKREAFAEAYQSEIGRLSAKSASSGGSFYPTLKARVGLRFGSALVASTLAGRTSFSEAFRYLGIRKVSTLHNFAARLEVSGR